MREHTLAKKKKKRRSVFGAVMDGLLSLIDFICEGISSAFMALLAAAGRLLAMIVRTVFVVLAGGLRMLLSIPGWIIRRLTAGRNAAHRCLRLDGPEFEAYVALVLADNGFRHVQITKGSGDQGVDILCERNGRSYAIQCKNYDGAVGNFAVQEAYAGAEFYGYDVPVVICPGTFTRGAIELAESTGVTLWDGERLSRMMKKSGRKPRHLKA